MAWGAAILRYLGVPEKLGPREVLIPLFGVAGVVFVPVFWRHAWRDVWRARRRRGRPAGVRTVREALPPERRRHPLALRTFIGDVEVDEPGGVADDDVKAGRAVVAEVILPEHDTGHPFAVKIRKAGSRRSG